MDAFEYRQAQATREGFLRHGVRYLFPGKSGAVLLGFTDTTPDADLFVEEDRESLPRLRSFREYWRRHRSD